MTFSLYSGVQIQLVDPGQVETKMTELFADKLSWSVPTPSQFVKSAIKCIGYSNHTCGYWPHSLQTVIGQSIMPEWLMAKALVKAGNKNYQHALDLTKNIKVSN